MFYELMFVGTEFTTDVYLFPLKIYIISCQLYFGISVCDWLKSFLKHSVYSRVCAKSFINNFEQPATLNLSFLILLLY